MRKSCRYQTILKNNEYLFLKSRLWYSWEWALQSYVMLCSCIFSSPQLSKNKNHMPESPFCGLAFSTTEKTGLNQDQHSGRQHVHYSTKDLSCIPERRIASRWEARSPKKRKRDHSACDRSPSKPCKLACLKLAMLQDILGLSLVSLLEDVSIWRVDLDDEGFCQDLQAGLLVKHGGSDLRTGLWVGIQVKAVRPL